MLQNIQTHKYYPLLLYVVALTAALFSVNYFYLLGQPASGYHFWRQTDSISFVAYYYENGMNFFEPGTYAMNIGNGRAASEFPILYYITAALWHIFGRHDYILKLVDSAIVFTGFYCLFKIAIKQLGNIYTALFLTLLFLSSTTLLFYTNNFLPDPPSLGLTLIGAYFFFQFIDKKQYKFFVLAIVLLTLSVLIKPSMAAFLLAITGLLVFEKLFKVTINTTTIFNQNAVKYILPLFVSFGLIISWIIWVKHYNNANGCYIFLTQVVPYWKSTPKEIALVWDNVRTVWYGHYYYYTSLHVFWAIAILGLINIKKWSRVNVFIFVFLLIGAIGYVLLFFKQFGPHDYYMLPIFVPFAFLVLFSLASIFNRFPVLKRSTIPSLALMVLTILSLNFANKKMESRRFLNNINSRLFELTGKLEDYGVPQGATILSFPDATPNGSLYYLRRKGYTNWDIYDKKNMVKHLPDFFIHKADYMIISHPDYYEFANTHWYQTQQVGAYKDIRMYKIISAQNATN